MLADIDLALAVAQAVSDVDALRTASFIALPSGQPNEPSQSSQSSWPSLCSASQAPESYDASSHGWHWSKLAALAASLLVVVGFINYQATRQVADLPTSEQLVQQRLVENWLALGQVELVDVSGNLVDISSNAGAAREGEVDSGDAVATDVSTESDWLMDAAREFFSQREAG